MAKGINDELQTSFVTMSANVQRLSEAESLIVIGTLKDLENELVSELRNNPDLTKYTKARYNSLIAQNREIIKNCYNNIRSNQQGMLVDVAGIEQTATRKAFASVGIPLNSVALNADQLKSLASNALIEGAPSSGWWAKQSRNLQDAFAQQMRIGYASGETIDQLVTRVIGTSTGKKVDYVINGKTKRMVEYKGGIMDTGYNQAKALVRTSIMQISADARMETFKRNADIIKCVQWVATLDLRTTLLCASRSDLLYDLDGMPIDHDLPFLGGPPAHFQCRSILAPVTKSWEELGATPGVDKLWKESISKAVKASMNGYVPISMTFEQWFDKLPQKDQISYLGKKRYAIWKKGNLSLAQLTNKNGTPLTIEQLAKAYGYELTSKPKTISIPKEIPSAMQVEQAAQSMATKKVAADYKEQVKTATESIEKIREGSKYASTIIDKAKKSGAWSDDPIANDAYLKSVVKQEAKIEETLAATKRKAKDTLTNVKNIASLSYIGAKEKMAALVSAESVVDRLPSEKNAIYESTLADIQSVNKTLGERLNAVIATEPFLMAEYNKFKKTKSYRPWDMEYTIDKFKKMIASSDMGKSSARILKKLATL